MQGINCIAFSHLLLKRLHGLELPPALYSREMLDDNTYFRELQEGEELEVGDIALFSRAGINFREIPSGLNREDYLQTGYPLVHLAIFAGFATTQSEPLYVHANHPDRGVSIWPLSKFSRHLRYRELYGIKRAI